MVIYWRIYFLNPAGSEVPTPSSAVVLPRVIKKNMRQDLVHHVSASFFEVQGFCWALKEQQPHYPLGTRVEHLIPRKGTPSPGELSNTPLEGSQYWCEIPRKLWFFILRAWNCPAKENTLRQWLLFCLFLWFSKETWYSSINVAEHSPRSDCILQSKM